MTGQENGDFLTGRDYLDKATNSIDAAMFSGDPFLDPKARLALRNLMARWERGLQRWEDVAAELAAESSSDDDIKET